MQEEEDEELIRILLPLPPEAAAVALTRLLLRRRPPPLQVADGLLLLHQAAAAAATHLVRGDQTQQRLQSTERMFLFLLLNLVVPEEVSVRLQTTRVNRLSLSMDNVSMFLDGSFLSCFIFIHSTNRQAGNKIVDKIYHECVMGQGL
mmetsp:Transcript_36261/g.55705  ORF Transcript_36261/g.55705 Transcript_36261/m.55705 type:complete len:147 (-) Transcript_36261:68-508(-)